MIFVCSGQYKVTEVLSSGILTIDVSRDMDAMLSQIHTIVNKCSYDAADYPLTEVQSQVNTAALEE